LDSSPNLYIHNSLLIHNWKGFQMSIDIKEILFWIFLALGIILLVWNIFGNSPTEFIAIVSLIFTILLKLWSVSDRQIKSEMRFISLKKSFIKLAKDFTDHSHHNQIINQKKRTK